MKPVLAHHETAHSPRLPPLHEHTKITHKILWMQIQSICKIWLMGGRIGMVGLVDGEEYALNAGLTHDGMQMSKVLGYLTGKLIR